MSLKVPFLPCLPIVVLACASCSSGSKSSASANTTNAPLSVDAVKVSSQTLKITVHLPGELTPYETVDVYSKVTGFVKLINVDRGSHVRYGELITELEAPELTAQRAEAEAKLNSSESQLAAAQAKLASDESTYEKLNTAAATPGVVAKNDVVVAEKTTEADKAQMAAAQDNVNAARQALQSIKEIESYLEVRAPFDGIVTQRNVHPGALVGPAGGPGASLPIVNIQMVSRLRLVVPVPENYASGIPEGTKVNFTVPAYPGETFSGAVARVSHAVDEKTRTMPVEIDVTNPSGRLAPGTFSDVLWSVQRPQPTLFLPSSAVASTLQRVFVVRISDNVAEWVDVKTGATSGNLTEVFGDLHEGDVIVLRGTDEIQPGNRVTARLSSAVPKGT